MKLCVYGITSIVAQGLSAISDKLNFINQVDIIRNERDIPEITDQFLEIIIIIPFEEYFSNKKLQDLFGSNQNYKLILIADLYKLEVEKVSLNTSLANIIICKECKEYEFIHALWAAKESDKYFCSEVLNYILKIKPTETNNDLSILTEREIEVLKLIGGGFSSLQIADELFISKHTVNSHRKKIIQKLQLQNPSQLIQIASSIF